MNKAQLVERVKDKLVEDKISKQTIASVLQACFDKVRQAVVSGEGAKIKGLGTFGVKKQNAKLGYNPNTGKRFFVPQVNKISFKTNTCLLRNQLENKVLSDIER